MQIELAGMYELHLVITSRCCY